MKKSRVISMMLIALLATQTLVSCGDNSNTPSGDETTEAPKVVDPYEGWVLDDLPEDLKFEGETFTIFFGHPVGNYIMEEETGDPVDDAVYQRNKATEERFGITLSMEKSAYGSDGGSQGEATKQISSNILAGDNTNDIYIHVQHTGMPGLIAQGLFRDWNEFPYFNFDKEYWYRKCLDDINYYDKVYAMTGAYNTSSLTIANCLLFNKRICDDIQMDYPYQLVKDGKWTVDEFIKYIKNGTADLNGDGKIDPKVDQAAYWGWGYESIPALYMGLGGDTVIKKADGSPELNVNNERTFKVVDKMLEVFAEEGSTWEYTTYGIFNDAFNEGRLLFLHGGLGSTFRDMKDDYGYIPYPKLDEDQQSYCARVQNTSGLTYIPVTNTKDALTSAVLEYMAMYSYNTIVPAYFDINLTVKGTRDTESEEMIPIIRDACSFYDEAVAFNVSPCITNKTGLASYWAEKEAAVKQSLQENIIDVYGK